MKSTSLFHIFILFILSIVLSNSLKLIHIVKQQFTKSNTYRKQQFTNSNTHRKHELYSMKSYESLNKGINSIKVYESKLLSKSALIFSLSMQSLLVKKVNAGDVRPPTAQEEKDAVGIIKGALLSTAEMANLAKDKKYEDIGKLFESKYFTEFENACSTLTKSTALSQEDRKSLGTIKRYGVVADAIIMIGGIKGELTAGGVRFAGGTSASLQKSIEDDVDDDDDEVKEIKVNYPEIQRYIKLSYDSINDIYKIVSQIK